MIDRRKRSSFPSVFRGTLGRKSFLSLKLRKQRRTEKQWRTVFIKKINAENEDCCTFSNSNWGWESRTDKTESAAGLSLKKRMPQWQMFMVTLRRVYMSQSAEPFRIDSSQSAQVFSKFGSIPASLLSHVESIPKKNEPSRSEAIIVDGWCSGSIVSMH